MSKTVGEYLLKEKIGKGSYADVYKGTHKVTGIKYAIKTISKDILSEPKLLAGLESEIKIMREFVHPNIVCLHEYFSSEKNFYLILELCEGGDLSKFIKKKRRIDERLAHNFLTQITSGLAFLHEKNFIHRDLKPANVLLSEFSDNAVLKLADFGFARQLSVASLAQTRCGTPLYMAPEILESKDYDGKADIWSVGCIFYEMLVGTSPFKGANEGDLLMNIKTKELNVPNDVVLSEVSIQILIKLLERYPLRRAALPQLVALCAHITSNPPPLPVGSSSSGAGGEEAGLALPIPSPTSSETKSGGDMHHSYRGRTPDAPSANAEPRRRSSTNSIPSNEIQQGNEPAAFISPVKANPRDYPGGPAVGNLRGMFAPATDANPHTPPPPNYQDSRQGSNTYSPSHQQQGQGQESQGHARRNSGTYYDPQISKTVRAPYANPNAMPNKYPSPSSSPPSGGMSNVGAGFSMQTTHNARSAPTHSTSIASSPSTIGIMGNLIAYVFNPSPSPPSTMNESARAHAHQKQHQAGHHGRSISLDRATPPNFAGQFGNNGGGTPPPVAGNRARGQSGQNSNRNMREDHFAYAEQDSLYNAKDGGGNSSSNMSDEDFVMIDKSSTERNDARGTPTNHSHPSQQASQTNSASTSSYSGSGATSVGNSTGLLVGVVPPPVPPVQTRAAPPASNDYTNNNHNNQNNYANNNNNYANQSYHLESEVRTHEAAAMHAFYASIVQKCEVYCAVVAAISALGDQYVRESLTSAPAEKPQSRSRGGSMDGADDEDDSIAGFLQQPSQDSGRHSHSHSIHSGHKPAQHQAAVDRYLTACSLYLHALSILANLLRSFDNTTGAEQAEPMRGVMQKLKNDVSTVFEQLIARAESCQKQIDQLVNPTGSASVHALSASKYTMPQAEPIMVQAALKREADAAMEELLGNLNLASKLYGSANELVEGVALTAHDPEDQRKLHLYSASLLDKHRSCRRRAEELLIFS